MAGTKLTGQVQGNDSCTASHSPQAVVDGAAAHLKVVHDNGRETGGGVEQRRVGDDKIDLVRPHTCKATEADQSLPVLLHLAHELLTAGQGTPCVATSVA